MQAAARPKRGRNSARCSISAAAPACRLPFRPFSDWMVGVDLSAAMLAQARAKGLYDRLIEAEALAFLEAEAKIGAHYHLVLAADVFMYFDDLAPVLKAAAQVLAPSGTACLQRRDAGRRWSAAARNACATPMARRTSGRRWRQPGLKHGQPRFRLDSHRKRAPVARPDRGGHDTEPWNLRAIYSTTRPAAAGRLCALVRAAAAGSRARISSTAGESARRPLGAADRADRRRQDARRLPADAGRAERTRRAAAQAEIRPDARCGARRACTRSTSRR